MHLQLEVTDSAARDLFTEVAKSLQRFGETKLIESFRYSVKGDPLETDGSLTIAISPRHKLRYICEAKMRLDSDALAPVVARLQMAARLAEAKPLLITPYVNDSVGEQLRAGEVNYIDAVGNAFLADSPLYIWIRGFKPAQKPQRVTRAFQASGLQLIALLLSHPEAINWPYRQLADAAGVSLGSLSRLLSDLRSLGFITIVASAKNALIDRRRLLDNWLFGYSTRLRPRLKPQTFRQADDLPAEQTFDRIPTEMKDEVLLGGELGAAIATGHLRPQGLTFHFRPHGPLLPLIKQMKLIPDRSGNITLIEQFGDGSKWIWHNHSNQRLVHPLLLYAELVHGKPDSRLLETAKLIMDTHLAPMLKE